MSVKSQHVVKSAGALVGLAARRGVTSGRGFAGNHTVMRKLSETSGKFRGQANRVTAGLSEVKRPLLQRKCACDGSGTDCEKCKQKGIVQAKFAVSEPGDRYEQEADRVANQVMAAPGTATVGKGTPQIQRVANKTSNAARPVTSSVDRALAGPSRPLDLSIRNNMEPRFNRDFSAVRVYSGPAATQSAQEVNARSYTVGQNIVFGAGQFTPGTPAGNRLVAHELTHVVQQSGGHSVRHVNRSESPSLFLAASGTSPQLQRKVVDDNAHLPCRAVAGRSAADVSARENEAANFAEQAAAAVRASPLAEPTRALVWRRFRLDYNDQLTRCRFLPEIGDRFARIAREIRNTEMEYSCVAAGEPSTLCNTSLGVAHIGPFGGQKIDLCSSFWTAGPDQQALTLLHEWSHYVFSTRGLNDELPGGFDTAECYNAFASEHAGLPITGPEDINCVPNTRPLPALDRGRLHLNCSTNVFFNLSLFGGYARGLTGGNYATAGLGLDFLFPLTRMHDWELALGGRYLRFAPTDSKDRAAYLLGVRAALNTRYRPWRFGSVYGAYVEGGRLSVAGETGGEQTQPYAAGGVTAGLNFRIGRQASLQILGEVGGGFSFATENKDRFKWFQTGLTVVFQFE
ncbi:MAG: DUF4157 domain-containing protein [Pyrinomonadaceae bacterium]|nr:DUF4157 domain-containing protein [Pyrinomonadaceae bacterium]